MEVRWSSLGSVLMLAIVVACCPVATLQAASLIDASNWATSGPAAITLQNLAGNQLQFTYNDNPAGYSLVTWTLTATAPIDETITFQWNHSGNHAYAEVTEFADAFVYGPGGQSTFTLSSTGPVNCCSSPSAGFNYSGTITLTLHEGYTFGFHFGGSNFDANNFLEGAFTLGIESSPAPEPASLMLVLPGLLAVVGLRPFGKNRPPKALG